MSFSEFNMLAVQARKWHTVWMSHPQCVRTLPSIRSHPSPFPGLVLCVQIFQSCILHQFSITDVTNCHKLGAQIYYLTVQEKSELGLTGLKSGYQQGYIPSAGSWGEFISLPFLGSRGCVHSLACGSLPSSKPAMAACVFLVLPHSDTEATASLLHL